jgi:hypothetical protein
VLLGHPFAWVEHALATFWLGHPPLSGLWRIYLYGGLLVLAVLSGRHSPPFGDSPLQAPEVVKRSHPDFYEPQGLMRGVRTLATHGLWLRTVRAVLVVAWLACLVGLGGRWAPLLVAVSAWFLHGAMAGALGTNHRWVVPLGVLAAAPLVDLNATWSLDSWLATVVSGYPFPPASSGTLPSGFLRQLAMVIAVYTLVAGGLSKLRLGGWRWLDGESLRYFVSRPGVGAWPALKHFLSDHPLACRGLAVGTVALELGTVAALVVPELRAPLLVGAALFHLGIWLTMNPNYLPQTWCYVLAAGGGTTAVAVDRSTLGTGSLVALCGATLLGLGLVWVACRGIERWPLTCVPMYAFYRGPAERWSHDSIHDASQAAHLGREFVDSRLPYPLAWGEGWVRLQVVTGDGRTRTVRPPGVLRKHWNRLIHRAAALQLADRRSAAAQAFLDGHRSALLASRTPDELADRDCVVQLVCRVGRRDEVMGVLTASSRPSSLGLGAVDDELPNRPS